MTCTILPEWYIRREGKMAANDKNCWWVHRLFPGHKLYSKESYFWENHLSTEKNHEERQKISLRSDAPWLYLYSMHWIIKGIGTFILKAMRWQPKKKQMDTKDREWSPMCTLQACLEENSWTNGRKRYWEKGIKFSWAEEKHGYQMKMSCDGQNKINKKCPKYEGKWLIFWISEIKMLKSFREEKNSQMYKIRLFLSVTG